MVEDIGSYLSATYVSIGNTLGNEMIKITRDKEYFVTTFEGNIIIDTVNDLTNNLELHTKHSEDLFELLQGLECISDIPN